ncbi:MAG: GYD domain-containing protein [Methanospirillum sp.]
MIYIILHAPLPLQGAVGSMHFIALVNWKGKPDRERIAENLSLIEVEAKREVRYLNIYWTLGRYDAVALFEAPDEKAAMKSAIIRGDLMDIETLVAIPAEEARKLVE